MRAFATALFLVLALVLPARADQTDPRLTGLFAQLQATRSGLEARALEQLIWERWLETEDDDARILLRQGMLWMSRGDYPRALAALTGLVETAPRYAEGWNKRATLYFLMRDFASSIADIERTLALEPRHFGALSGLGQIYLAQGDRNRALKAFEAALAVHPHLDSVREAVGELKKALEGEPT